VELEQQIQTDMLDLAILWSDLRVRRAATRDKVAAHEGALAVLAEAEGLLGNNGILDRERRVHARALGNAPAAARVHSDKPARTAWEHVGLGRAFFRAGDLSVALERFSRAVEMEPASFWGNFYKGKCAFQLGNYQDAVMAFQSCVVLAPERAWCYYNRALASAALGRLDAALLDFNRTLELDPGLAEAARDRGLLHFREKRYSAALVDFDLALDRGADAGAIHYHKALIFLDTGDRARATDNLNRALQHDPMHKKARALLEKFHLEP